MNGSDPYGILSMRGRPRGSEDSFLNEVSLYSVGISLCVKSISHVFNARGLMIFCLRPAEGRI